MFGTCRVLYLRHDMRYIKPIGWNRRETLFNVGCVRNTEADCHKCFYSNQFKAKSVNQCLLLVTTYGLEAMALTEKCSDRLWVMQQSAIERSILRISLRAKITSTGIKDILKRTAEWKRYWVGHMMRINPERWAYKVTNWRSRPTARSQNKPQKRVDPKKNLC